MQYIQANMTFKVPDDGNHSLAQIVETTVLNN